MTFKDTDGVHNKQVSGKSNNFAALRMYKWIPYFVFFCAVPMLQLFT